MTTPIRALVTIPLVVVFASPANGQWVEFADETTTRLPTPLNDPALSTLDIEEKDYAWGDVDLDGDIDLVVVRKEPFTTVGRRTNVLFMNEGVAEGHAVNGVLVDRTAQYATTSDVPGDQGFLTPTNDRDVVLHDLDNDGWLDMVTAPTLTDFEPSYLSHPRVYINLGEVDGEWQGFRYESSRIPVMHQIAGPRFAAVAAGDVTGDGYADLYFADYDNGVTGDPAQIFDYNNRLLINLGAANPGRFVDQTESRLTFEMLDSEFGTACNIADMNGDGRNDIVKDSALVNYHVSVTYNSPGEIGQFDEGGAYETVAILAPYFSNVGDLNNDGRMDIMITDDAVDRYFLNQGNGVNGLADFIGYVMPGTDGFGGNSTITDLDKDGFLDVIITDVDIDVPGCGNRTFIMHNSADPPEVSFIEHDQVIPDADLIGVHDAAVFDINGDGYNDIVMGRCIGTQVWMNQPPYGLSFAYPGGVPELIAPDTPTTFDITVIEAGGAAVDPGSGRLFTAIDGGVFTEQAIEHLGGSGYRATLPPASCAARVEFYVRFDTVDGGVFLDPGTAPKDTYSALASEGVPITFDDDLETDDNEWVVVDDPSLTSGTWERVDPVGTLFGVNIAAPEDDASSDGTFAFVTGNGVPGGAPGASDVDGGPTWLLSPVIDVAGSDAFISFARWFYCEDAGGPDGDFMYVDVSNDGGATWTALPDLTTGGTNGQWEAVSFVLGEHVEPTSSVVVRFWTVDEPNNSITEAGIDEFVVRECVDTCAGDVDSNGTVDIADLLALLSAWGPCAGCPSDLNGDDVTSVADLLLMLAAWGPCAG